MKQQLTPKQIAKVDAVFEQYSMQWMSAVDFANENNLSDDEKQYFFALDMAEACNCSVADFDDIVLTGTESVSWIEKFVAEKIAANEEIAQTNRDIREDENFYKSREL